MPYASTDDLPPSLQVRLPLHAQQIYIAAFNTAFAEYSGNYADDREATAHRIAWAAVKKLYRKQGENWVARERG
jgi:cation transport regulator